MGGKKKKGGQQIEKLLLEKVDTDGVYVFAVTVKYGSVTAPELKLLTLIPEIDAVTEEFLNRFSCHR